VVTSVPALTFSVAPDATSMFMPLLAPPLARVSVPVAMSSVSSALAPCNELMVEVPPL
jgi:hypothetical protein